MDGQATKVFCGSWSLDPVIFKLTFHAEMVAVFLQTPKEASAFQT